MANYKTWRDGRIYIVVPGIGIETIARSVTVSEYTVTSGNNLAQWVNNTTAGDLSLGNVMLKIRSRLLTGTDGR